MYEIIIHHQNDKMLDDEPDNMQTQLNKITDFVNDLTKITIEIGLEAPKKILPKNRNLSVNVKNKRRNVVSPSKLKKRNVISAK